MSQEINLLNPALRPKRDWLDFRHVAMATGVAALMVAAVAAVVRYEFAGREREQAAVASRLELARQSMQSMQSALAVRKSDPSLTPALEQLEATLAQRREVLKLARGLAADTGGAAEAMRGFSRQRLEGLWLTAFSIGPAGFELSGRALDPLLLPTYIGRLNAEPAFRGRRFAALDMRGIEAGAPIPAVLPLAPPATGRPTIAGAGTAQTAPAGTAAPANAAATARGTGADGEGPVAALRFTEFTLRATLPKPPVENVARGAAQ